MADTGGLNRYAHYLRDELFERLGGDEDFLQFTTSHCLDGVFYWDLENPDNEFMGDRFWAVIGHDPATKAHWVEEWRCLIHPEDLERVEANIAAHLEDPSVPYDQVVRYKRASGDWVTVRSRAIALRDESGSPIRLFGTHVDINELATANRRLEAQQNNLSQQATARGDNEEQLQFLFDMIPLRIWYKDADNRILRANKAAADSVGSTPEALRNADTYALYPEIAEKYHEDDLEVINSGEARRGIVEPYAPKAGEQGWVRTDKIPVQAPDGSSTLLVIATDISETKRTEEKLRALTESSRQFASVAAHDLRAPLNQSFLMMEMVKEELERAEFKFSDEGQFAFDHVIHSLDRMRAMIDDLYTLSKLETEAVVSESVNLQKLLDEIQSESQELSDARATLKHDLQAPVSGSPRLVKQALTNLIANACKFNDEHRLTITVSTWADVKAQEVVLAVSDNGPGIPSEQTSRIFQPFVRLSNANDKDGTGLGLAIVSRIMSAHGGSACIDENYNRGARFLLRFPRTKG